MGKGIGTGPGRPTNALDPLSTINDASLVTIALFFLRRVRARSEVEPAIAFISSYLKMKH